LNIGEANLTLHEYLAVVGGRWRLVVGVVLAFVALAVGATFAISPIYQATTQLFVATHADANNLSQATDASTFSAARVKSYAGIATSPRVLDPVIGQLGLTTTARQLGSRVSADAPLDTVLINVSVKDSSPEGAARLANAIARQLSRAIFDLETSAGSREPPVHATVVSEAQLPQNPVWPSLPINLVLSLVFGLAVALGLAVVLKSRDTTVENEHDSAL
jgi:succinoglycan biosynthesis transport protein ExoP